MSTQLTIHGAFAITQENTEGALTQWVDKKGNTREMTTEGALWKGGDALNALKSEALSAALSKAHGGRYRAAYDVIVAAFPSIEKALATLHIGTPYGNKASMGTVLMSVLGQKPKAGKEFGQKQKAALELVRTMLYLPAFEHLRPAGEVVENEAEQQTQ